VSSRAANDRIAAGRVVGGSAIEQQTGDGKEEAAVHQRIYTACFIVVF
jgi:hypothetical protein